MSGYNQHNAPAFFAQERPQSMVEFAQRYLAGEDFGVLSGDFLDAFYRMSQIEKARAIQDEPIGLVEVDKVVAVSLAGVAEELAKNFGIEIPAWTAKGEYFLPDNQALFGIIPQEHADKETRRWFSEQSPISFSKRNLFVSANSLLRA